MVTWKLFIIIKWWSSLSSQCINFGNKVIVAMASDKVQCTYGCITEYLNTHVRKKFHCQLYNIFSFCRSMWTTQSWKHLFHELYNTSIDSHSSPPRVLPVRSTLLWAGFTEGSVCGLWNCPAISAGVATIVCKIVSWYNDYLCGHVPDKL